MNQSPLVLVPRIRGRWLSLVALLVLALPGCGKDSNPPTGPVAPTTTTMTGVMINGAENGRLDVTINTTSLAPQQGGYAAYGGGVDASATYRPIGASVVNLSGLYDPDTDNLALGGGGYSVSAMLEIDSESVSTVGQYNGPNGIGLFGAVQTSGSSPVPVFCGTYSGSTDNGNLGFLSDGTDIGGIIFSAVTTDFYPFEGMLSGSGTTRTITGTGGENDDSLTFNGTYNTTTGTSSGTWDLYDKGTMMTVDSGTWSASECP